MSKTKNPYVPLKPLRPDFVPDDYHTKADWMRLMRRAGFSPEFILSEQWTPAEIRPIICGWFDRVEDHKIILRASTTMDYRKKSYPKRVATKNMDGQ